MKNTLYLGLDVHKDSITIAIAMAGRNGEVRLYGAISNDLHAIEKALRKLDGCVAITSSSVCLLSDLPLKATIVDQAASGRGVIRAHFTRSMLCASSHF